MTPRQRCADHLFPAPSTPTQCCVSRLHPQRQRRRGQQINAIDGLKDVLNLQVQTSLVDTLSTASNAIAELDETERLLLDEISRQRHNRAELEAQSDVRMVRTVMLQKQLREEVEKGDSTPFVSKVDTKQSEMTAALLQMGKAAVVTEGITQSC